MVDIGIIDRGKEVLSCSKDGSVKMWNCGSAECLKTWCPEVGVVNALSVARSSAGNFQCFRLIFSAFDRREIFSALKNSAGWKKG